MKDTRLPGVLTWSEYQADRRIDFNGFLWSGEGERPGVLFDPMPLSPEQRAQVAELGGAAWILLTNADHLRAAVELKAAFGARLAAPDCERGRLGAAAEAVDLWLAPGGALPAELDGAIGVHWVGGGKSELEAAFELRPLNAVLFGDVVRSHVVGDLRLLPDPKLQDRARAVADLTPLLSRPWQAVLLGDGDSLFRDADAAVAAFRNQLGVA
jgi:hypothetical protein